MELLGVSPNDRLLVAVSGGADSSFLLHLLFQISDSYPFQLHVAHLNHALRGKDSDEDARFVRRMADAMKIPSTVAKKEIASLAKLQKRSMQDAARKVRYEFLEDIASRYQCHWIVTGHHADDQAETFLMRLIRGAGSSGLTSIPKKRGKIIRPILHVTRTEIIDYLRLNKMSFREDYSNDLPIYFRNQVRHELLPLLKRYNPNIVKVLGDEMNILQEEKQVFEERIHLEMPAVVRFSDSKKKILRISSFMSLSRAIQRGILRSLLYQLKGNLDHLQFKHIEQIIRLAKEGKNGKQIDLPAGIQVFKQDAELEFAFERIPDSSEKFDFLLPVPGEISRPELQITLRTLLKRGPLSGPPKANEIWFDYDRITHPLKLRCRRPGDLIYTERLKGKKKKLQDLFVDLKISRPIRDRIPLLAGPDRILWVVGIERDYKSLVNLETQSILSIESFYPA
ncbi:MAG: tRNA lysidine(34) synthetase TilS [Nitrospirae bacterium]|nr:tRNA lysidine(34) synthetase TilS [Nitrospirota bacterium]